MPDFFEEDEIDYTKARVKEETEIGYRYNEKREKAKAILTGEGELSLDPNQYWKNCLKIEDKIKELK